MEGCCSCEGKYEYKEMRTTRYHDGWHHGVIPGYKVKHFVTSQFAFRKKRDSIDAGRILTVVSLRTYDCTLEWKICNERKNFQTFIYIYSCLNV